MAIKQTYGPLAVFVGASPKGDENAEDEDQKGRCQAVQNHRHR